MPKPSFKAIVNNNDAKRYRFKRRSKGSIASSASLEQEMARVWAGLSLAEFDDLPGNPEWVNYHNPKRSKASIVAAYRMANLLDSIQDDLSYTKK